MKIIRYTEDDISLINIKMTAFEPLQVEWYVITVVRATVCNNLFIIYH